MNQTQLKILNLLSHTEPRSGTWLGQHLNISRTAVWKNIRQLIDLGLPIQVSKKNGYYLETPIALLDKKTIINELKQLKLNHPIDLTIHQNLTSTNLYLKQCSSDADITVCASESQSAGRGRFNRSWYSPFGENIYCSVRFQFQCDLSELSGLSLAASLAVKKALQNFVILDEIKIKWPNDLLWQDKKLCGMLIEIQGESHGAYNVIVGIGLNVNTKTQHTQVVDQPWCSLFDIQGQYFNRNVILAHLINNLHEYVSQYKNHGFESFLNEWKQADYLYNQPVTIYQSQNIISGKAKGVCKSGLLKIELDNGKIQFVASGDASLRKKN